MSSVKQNLKSKNKEKITKWSLMREISSEPNSLRNEELALLYEKIKIQKSTLKKGEIYYQERLNDIINIRKHISDLKRQLNVS